MKPRRIVSDSIARLIDPEVRAELGITTAAEDIATAVRRSEKAEHGIFENWLNLHGFAYRHSRTDKATRETVGAPDFTVYQKTGYLKGETFYPMASMPIASRCLAVEFKLPGNKLSQDQEEWAVKYGGIVHVLATASEAIELVKREFGE